MNNLQTYQPGIQLHPLNFSDNSLRIIGKINRSLKPRIRLAPADWADAYFKIPPKSARSGDWFTSEVEYTREILNSIADPNID